MIGSFINESNSAAVENIEDEKCYNTIGEGKVKPLDGQFTWSKQLQSQVLSAFFYGHIISQVCLKSCKYL